MTISCTTPTAKPPRLAQAGEIIRSTIIERSSSLSGPGFALLGTMQDAPESCICMIVCDEHGNCTDCTCDPKGCGTCEDVASEPFAPPLTRMKVNVEPVRQFLDEEHPPIACKGPPPADIGCTTICKPCIVHFCLDGAWESEDLTLGDDLCSPDPLDPDPAGSLTACPRGVGDFCPAECSVCY